MKLDTLVMRGKKIDVFISGNGEFSAQVGQDDIKAPTLAALKERIERAVKHLGVKPVEFIKWDGEVLKCGRVTGRRQDNNNLLVKWDGEKGGEQVWRLDEALDPTHLVEYGKLCEAVRVAEGARLAFAQKHELDVAEAIDRNIREGIA